MSFTGLRRRRGVVENVSYFDNDDELEKKMIKRNVDVNIDKDSIKTCAQILIEVLFIDLPIPHMRIESIARGVVNMICD